MAEDLGTTYAYRAWAGYRRHSRARSTGSVIVLVDGRAQGLCCEGDLDGPWFLICDEHDTILSDDHQKRLIRHMACPEGWCAECYRIVKQKETPQ